MKESIRPGASASEGIRFSRFYQLNLMSHLLGFFMMATINFFTPLGFIQAQKAYIFAGGGWKVLGSLWPLVLLITFLVQRWLIAPIRPLAAPAVAGFAVSKSAQRRILNLPLASAFVNLAVWAVIAAAVAGYFRIFRGVSIPHSLLLFFRSFMIGLVTAGLSFFLLENHLREKWIPMTFPEGKLTAVSGALRIPVRRRIRVLWAAGTLNPMIILVGTLFFTWLEIRDSPVSPEAFAAEILLFALLLCGMFVAIALGLNFLVEKSIRGPVAEMLRATRVVGRGDFSHRIKVVSNDEIGVLGDAGNEMIAGLADRERIRETFGRYVAPEIRDRILAGLVPPLGERTTATVLFSDLRDFTPYVEENSPEEVVKSMRSYFSSMQRAISDHGGLVLQYVGDEMEAAFGAPIPDREHAEKAVLAALAMRAALAQWNQERIECGKLPFRHGIGIHTGPVLAGNTGSENLLSYALIGETVNLAARIQDLTKLFLCDILISKETADLLGRSFSLKMESPATVKGHSKPVTVYRVLG